MARRTKTGTKQEMKDGIADLIGVLNERAANLKQAAAQEERAVSIKKSPAQKKRRANVRKKPEAPVWTGQYDDLILGNGPKGTYSMDPQKSAANSNTLVVSSTSGGKTTSVVEANLLHAEFMSMVILLTKRRLLDQYGPYLKKRGYEVKVLDLVNPQKSDVGYDPIRHIKDDGDIRSLTKHLVKASGCASPRDPYWETSPASLLSAFIKLAKHKFGKHASMTDVLELFRYIGVRSKYYEDEDTGEEIEFKYCPAEDFAEYREIDPNMYLDWNQYRTNHPNTAACIQGVLNAALGNIADNSICRLMDMKQQLDFTSLVQKKTVLFIITSPVNTAHHPYANLLLGSMFKELFEYAESLPTGRLPIPLRVICDDFATGGQIPDFQQHISIFREKGISVMMLVQSLSQLAAMYDDNGAKIIRDNTDNTVYLGGNDVTTAAEISYRINRPVDEVLALPIGQEYLIRRGQPSLKLQRYQLYDDPLYRKVFKSGGAASSR